MISNKCLLWTALVTPLTSKGEIDYDSLRTLINKQQNAGNGILLLGSTGEALALNLAEKKAVLNFVGELKPTVPLMVGVGGFQLDLQLEWISFCHTQQVDCFLLPVPLYAKPGMQGQIAWFKRLLDYSQKPCMLYNIPYRTGMRLHPAALKVLQSHQNLWALKESSGGSENLSEYLDCCPGFNIYSGDDILMPELAKVGASGLISVASNVWPVAVKYYLQQCLDGELQDKALWKQACNSLFTASNPIPVKRLLHYKKWINSDTLRLPLIIDELPEFSELIEADRKIAVWLTETGLARKEI